MKTSFIAIGLLLICTFAFSQRVIDEKAEVRYVQLPMTVLPDVASYTCVWNNEAIKQDIPEIDTELGYNHRTVAGYLALQGFSFTTDHPDVTLTLESGRFELPTPAIVDISESDDATNFRAKYTIPFNWMLKIDGKITKTIDLSESNKMAVVLFPPKLGSLGQPGQVIPKADAIEKHLELKQEEVEKYVIQTALSQFFAQIQATVQSELCYTPKVKEIKIKSFKTTKKEDFSAWDKPYERGQELLTKISSGSSPSKLYTEYKEVFEFWDAQMEQHKTDLKTNKKILKVTTHNLLELLALVNPAAVKQTYIDIYKEVNHNNEELFATIESQQKRQEANTDCQSDYTQLCQLPPLRKYCYETAYTTSKGEQKTGIIKFTSPYGINPFETGNTFDLYDLDNYLAENGSVTSKHKIDQKGIQSYELLGQKYTKTKYTDPTAVSIGGNESFLEEVVIGKMSVFKYYGMEMGDGAVIGGGLTNNSNAQLIESRCNPQFVVKYGKKSTVVFNYSKLASLLKDCKTVADKIKDGSYGNKQIAEKSSKLGKFMQQGTHNEISEEVILKITEEFNTLM